MSDTPIADYALLADCNSAALVSREGSVDWLCFPRYDSPSVFGRLLDPDAGHWSIRPRDDFRVRRRYLPGTLVLETVFTTEHGELRLTDTLAFADGTRNHDIGLDVPHELLRVAEGLAGTVELLVEFAPRAEYGLSRPVLAVTPEGVRTSGGPVALELTAGVDLELDGGAAVAVVALREGDRLAFALRWFDREDAPIVAREEPSRLKQLLTGPPSPAPGATRCAEVAERVEDTVAAWRSWEEEHDRYDGLHREAVRTSSRVLKGLTYRPTGAVVAAATTSLPEQIGGERNWDYRYAWIRDASLTFEALWVGACPLEVRSFVDWMAAAAGGAVMSTGEVQIMYGVGGEHDLPERELSHLRGWRDSRPVRVGNAAHTQRQLDVLGEFLNVVALYAERLGELEPPVQRFVCDLADAAMRDWGKPDAGLWEARAEPAHHVVSKVMCWLALERAVGLADAIGADGREAEWARERDRIRETVLEEGFDAERGCFTQTFAGDAVDAALLLLPIVGFLPVEDPRMRATIEAIERELVEDGLVLRYRTPDGLEGSEGSFLICSFWLVICLARLGRTADAEALFERTAGCASDLGLLAEEADGAGGELLGNYPQAFSHIGLIVAAYELDQAAQR